MFRIIIFLLLTGAAGLGAAWIADQNGDVSLMWNGWRVSATLPVAVLGFGLAVAAILAVWSVVGGLLRLPRADPACEPGPRRGARTRCDRPRPDRDRRRRPGSGTPAMRASPRGTPHRIR